MANGMTQLGLDDLRREEEAAMGLGLAPGASAGGLPVDSTLGLRTPNGPASASPAAPPETPVSGGVEPTFENMLSPDASATIGQGPGDVRYADYAAAGGAQGLAETQRPDSAVTGALLDVTDAALGRTTGTQRAEAAGPKELSPWQKSLLFIADIVAMGEGNAPPSAQLDLQKWKALSLEDHAKRAAYSEGIANIEKITRLTASAPPEMRQAIMESQAEQLNMFGESMGAIGKALASVPNSGDVLHAFFSNPDAMSGTDAERVANFATAIAANDPEKAGQVWVDALKSGVFSNTINATGPSIIRAAIPDQIEAARKQKGPQADFANRLAAGQPITAEDYAIFNANLPESVRVQDAFIESLTRSPEDYIMAMPGLKSPKLETLRREKELNSQYSPVSTFINQDNGKWISGPELSPEMRKKMATGNWVKAHFSIASQGDLSKTDPFGRLRPNVVGEEQKKIIDSRNALNSLYSIRDAYDPDLLTMGAKAKDLWGGAQATLGIERSPEMLAFRERVHTLNTRSVELLNEMLHALSGAAVSAQEYARIASVMPNPEMDPDKFLNVLNERINMLTFYHVKQAAWQAMGSTTEAAYQLSNQEVIKFVGERAAQLSDAYRANYSGASDDQINVAVNRALASEMGVTPDDLIRALDSRGVIPGGEQ